MSEKPPKFVLDAIKRGDTEILRQAGRKGAEKTNARKDFERALKELESETQADQRAFEEAARKRSTNEDILTPDGEDTNEGFYFIEDED